MVYRYNKYCNVLGGIIYLELGKEQHLRGVGGLTLFTAPLVFHEQIVSTVNSDLCLRKIQLLPL